MGISRIFGLCAAFLFASSVAASTIDVGPSNWRNYGPSGNHTTGGVQSTFGQQVRMPPTVSGPTRLLPVSRNAVIPYGSIVNGAKNFARINPQSVAASAAITALFLGLDWVFDPELDSWATEGEATREYVSPIAGGFELRPTDGHIYNSAESACAAAPACSVGCTPDYHPALRGYCRGPDASSLALWNEIPITCPQGSTKDQLGCFVTIEGEYEVLTESDWSEFQSYLPTAPANTVAEGAGDSMQRQGGPLPGYQDLTMTGPASVTGPSSTSTSTDPVTGDTTVTNTSTQTNISYGDTTITTTNTTTTTTFQNGQETDTTVTTETPGELPVADSGGAPPAGEWPGFCDWATVVCDWLNWTQEDPPAEQDLPAVIDDDFYQEKSISFGAKSCPPDHQIDLAPFLSTSVAVSFQPLCDFAGLIYYMVMAASYIIAAYITIGVARNG